MYNISKNGIDHSKKRLDAVSMGREKETPMANNIYLPTQILKLLMPHLREVTIKADNMDLSGSASGVEVNCKFHAPNSHVVESHQVKNLKTIFKNILLFIVEKSIITFFKLIIMKYLQFLPFIFLN